MCRKIFCRNKTPQIEMIEITFKEITPKFFRILRQCDPGPVIETCFCRGACSTMKVIAV